MRMRPVALGLLACTLIACGHTAVRDDEDLSHHPASDKVAMVFMRPGHRLALQARPPRLALFRVTDDGQEYIGTLADLGQKLDYLSPPGDQLFMIIGGENTDFMQAHLDAGKTYYAVAVARMGVLKPRFSLVPVRKEGSKYSVDDFGDCLAKCKDVELSDENQHWYESNKPSVDRKLAAARKRWDSHDEEFHENKTLNREDGF